MIYAISDHLDDGLPDDQIINLLQVYSAPNSGAKYFVATVSWMTSRFHIMERQYGTESKMTLLFVEFARWRHRVEDADYDWRPVSDASSRTLR